jgi:hypothetical protein
MRRRHPPLLHILWDDSHIWGILATRALRAMSIPFRLTRGKEVATGLFRRERPSLLLMPGGNARHKAESLGPFGIREIREYVASGGYYLGFCGGAGLALTTGEPSAGLGLCPWKRGHFDERLQHFMSGHLRVTLPGRNTSGAHLVPTGFADSPGLPVWWPGRFDPEADKRVTILAAYEQPGSDFWLADLAIADLPPDTFAIWNDMYGVSITPTFLAGQPCVVYGHFEAGEYVLSYSHLETPDSPEANRWLAHLLRQLADFEPACEHIPPWSVHACQERAAVLWEDPLLAKIDDDFESIRLTGLTHGLLFERTAWLMGWRSGIPGASLNNLWAALQAIREAKPCDAAQVFLAQHGERLCSAISLFRKDCTQYFLAERLAQTVSRFMPEAVSPELLNDQRMALFGPPIHTGGLYKAIMDPLDELVYLQLAAVHS